MKEISSYLSSPLPKLILKMVMYYHCFFLISLLLPFSSSNFICAICYKFCFVLFRQINHVFILVSGLDNLSRINRWCFSWLLVSGSSPDPTTVESQTQSPIDMSSTWVFLFCLRSGDFDIIPKYSINVLSSFSASFNCLVFFNLLFLNFLARSVVLPKSK